MGGNKDGKVGEKDMEEGEELKEKRLEHHEKDCIGVTWGARAEDSGDEYAEGRN